MVESSMCYWLCYLPPLLTTIPPRRAVIPCSLGTPFPRPSRPSCVALHTTEIRLQPTHLLAITLSPRSFSYFPTSPLSLRFYFLATPALACVGLHTTERPLFSAVFPLQLILNRRVGGPNFSCVQPDTNHLSCFPNNLLAEVSFATKEAQNTR